MWGEARNKVDSDEDAFYISFGHALHIISRLKLMPRSEADFVIYSLMEEQLTYMRKRYEPKPTPRPDPYRISRSDEQLHETQSINSGDQGSGRNKEWGLSSTETTKAQPQPNDPGSKVDGGTGQIDRNHKPRTHQKKRDPKDNSEMA
jgi:hypothetical protein